MLKELGDYILQDAEKWSKERRLNEMKFNINSLKGNMYEEYSEYYRALVKGDYDEVVDALADALIYLAVDLTKHFESIQEKREIEEMFAIELQENIELAKEYGYDLAKVMQEVFKEINSRTGEWNDELSKWKKYETKEAKAKWYKANYSKTKIKKDKDV